MRVLVVTVVHTPLDARIHRRQVTALLDAGHRVVYAAPFDGHGVARGAVDPRLVTIDLPRAVRWRRGRALLAANRELRRWAEHVDVAILHDPELLLASVFVPAELPLVLDVHEDLAASLEDKPWVPSALTGVVRAVVAAIERLAERRTTLLLAEIAYADRFRHPYPVVPNLPPLPPRPRGPVDGRVVYLGRVSRLRGALELVAVGEQLAERGVRLQVLGSVDGDVREALEAASAAGHLELFGFVPNDEALAIVDGAMAGLSLLHDHPNYRHSMPTKVVEYQALGVPVITTPLPAAVEVVSSVGSGLVVPFGDVDAVVDAVMRLKEDRTLAERMSVAGRADAESGRSWDAVAGQFVAHVEATARRGAPRGA